MQVTINENKVYNSTENKIEVVFTHEERVRILTSDYMEDTLTSEPITKIDASKFKVIGDGS